MEHYYDKGLLEWLDGGLAPPRPRIVLDKQSGPERWDIWKLAASTRAPKNLKVLLNCKFSMAITKGSGTQACIKHD